MKAKMRIHKRMAKVQMVFSSENTKSLLAKKVFVFFHVYTNVLNFVFYFTFIFCLLDEQNVLSIHGKLYAWDADKTNWTEKGRGHLRLNDVVKNDKLCSRLGMLLRQFLRMPS